MQSQSQTMKTLVLPARYTEDSIAMRGAAIDRGWNVERFASWRAPAHLLERPVVLYGELLFCAAFAEQLGIDMLEPGPHLLAQLPPGFLLRAVSACSLGEARNWPATPTASGPWLTLNARRSPSSYETLQKRRQFRFRLSSTLAGLRNADWRSLSLMLRILPECTAAILTRPCK
jgi:hypothetical protein